MWHFNSVHFKWKESKFSDSPQPRPSNAFSTREFPLFPHITNFLFLCRWCLILWWNMSYQKSRNFYALFLFNTIIIHTISVNVVVMVSYKHNIVKVVLLSRHCQVGCPLQKFQPTIGSTEFFNLLIFSPLEGGISYRRRRTAFHTLHLEPTQSTPLGHYFILSQTLTNPILQCTVALSVLLVHLH